MARKSKMLSLRVTEDQFRYLDELAKRIKAKTGFKITRASIVIKLMEQGLPYLEQKFPASGQESDKPRFKKHSQVV